MALIEETLLGTVDKVKIAIDRLKAFEPPDGYYLAFSGGKDSVVIKQIAIMAGVKFDAHYNVTSVDPPELVRFIKDVHPDVYFDIPHDKDGKAITMWNLIPKKQIPPTRLARYCCAVLKESSGIGRVTITGVRWAESSSRKNGRNLVNISDKDKSKRIVYNDENEESRKTVEQCYRTRKTLVNPIIDWSDEDVWEFIESRKIPYCHLYDMGFKRLGCIGCPMNTNAEKELDAYPKYKAAYLRAFSRLISIRAAKGLRRCDKMFADENALMDWWLHGATNTDELTLLDELETESEDV